MQAMKEFKDGMDALGNNFPRQALVHLKNAVDLDKTNPFFLSYLGLVIAMVDGNFIEAEDLCDEAVRKQRTQPELYLNLAEVYRLAGKKEDAIDTLITGLKLTKQDARLAGALKKMGMRQPPVLTFLDRGNFLNVQLGKLRYKVLKGRGNKTKRVP
ncbi:MAG TPA: tetratricopeptide repeat protein [Terriglobia bacterium]|nr:tetratricopeptide repeat protein [Terriglobia bacterium]